MGLFRLLLAVCIFCAHARPLGHFPWLNGEVAVELFFVISGFYMQLVLSSRYTRETLGPGWIYQFYKARYFRILPVYLAGWLLSVTASILIPSFGAVAVWHAVWALPDSFGNCLFKIFLIVTNLTVFFQDATMFLALHHGQILWSANFRTSEIPLFLSLGVVQAWSLGIELSFYLLAPYLLNLRARWLLAGMTATLSLKFLVVYAYHLGDPWTYRFFPFELGYFLLGALAYRYRSWLQVPAPAPAGLCLTYVLAAGFTLFRLAVPLPSLTYPLAFALVLPFMFKATAHLKYDRLLGELSFPFYITHLLCIWFAVLVGAGWLSRHHIDVFRAAFGLTLMASCLLLALDLKLVEPWRTRFAIPQAGQQPGFHGTVIASAPRMTL